MKKLNIIRLLLIAVISLLLSTPALSNQQGNYITLETDSKQSFRVYLTGPMDAHRGILLIHGWLGLNEDIEVLADKFGKVGYRAMAIDLYNGEVASNPRDAKLLMISVKQPDANAKYSAALKALAAPGRKLATIGWSYGGSQALHATLSAPELVSATVSYYPYGKMISNKKTLAPMQGPILIQVGNEDFAFTPEKLAQYKVDIKNAGKILEVQSYNAKHSFGRPNGKNYNQTAQELAEKSTYQFLDMHLK